MFIKENQLKTFLCCVTLQFSVYMVNTSLLCFPRAVIPCLPNLLLLTKMTVTNQGGTAFSGLFFFHSTGWTHVFFPLPFLFSPFLFRERKPFVCCTKEKWVKSGSPYFSLQQAEICFQSDVWWKEASELQASCQECLISFPPTPMILPFGSDYQWPQLSC